MRMWCQLVQRNEEQLQEIINQNPWLFTHTGRWSALVEANSQAPNRTDAVLLGAWWAHFAVFPHELSLNSASMMGEK
jgi:hypothetical protein